ncbi:LacI family DNA-binding transcriptional regulator [Georgenia deserti]|uniref:LacI family DNA-binding transcriptional regulator n=1 Tax=Georgenia deserti TaxID=2093781 RepID=A0ABW4L350_9MICO
MSPRGARPSSSASDERAATLSQVAHEAGVSLATASRAINGSPDRVVGEDLRRRVLEAAARLDYSPDANAQAMARGRTATIGLIVHDIADPYFSTIAAGVSAAADEEHLAVTLANTQHDPARELAFVRTLQQQRARAIILAGGRQDDARANEALQAALAGYQHRGGTVALIGQPVLGVSTVRADNGRGAAALANALLDLGYRRFGILSGPDRHLTARERLEGFIGALDAAGVTPDAVVASAFTRDGGHGALAELRERAPEAEVVWAVNDVMALGAMTAAREAGLSVPDDLAFAGFDDISTLRDVAPPLTTVHLPLEEMGRLATPLALDVDGGVREVTVSGEVVVRASTPRR